MSHSASYNRDVVHFSGAPWGSPEHTACYKREFGAIQYTGSREAKKTVNPAAVSCKHCLKIIEGNLRNLAAVRLKTLSECPSIGPKCFSITHDCACQAAINAAERINQDGGGPYR